MPTTMPRAKLHASRRGVTPPRSARSSGRRTRHRNHSRIDPGTSTQSSTLPNSHWWANPEWSAAANQLGQQPIESHRSQQDGDAGCDEGTGGPSSSRKYPSRCLRVRDFLQHVGRLTEPSEKYLLLGNGEHKSASTSTTDESFVCSVHVALDVGNVEAGWYDVACRYPPSRTSIRISQEAGNPGKLPCQSGESYHITAAGLGVRQNRH